MEGEDEWDPGERLEGGMQERGGDPASAPWDPRGAGGGGQREGSNRGVLLREGKLEAAVGPKSAESGSPRSVGTWSPLRKSCQLGSIQGPGGLETAMLEGAASLTNSKEL